MNVSVYKISNKVNDKCYIGITTNFERRMVEHQKSKGNYPIVNALKKYGKDNFSFTVLDQVESWDTACEKEKYYISFFKTKAPNGYNLTDGGEGVVGLESKNKGKKGIHSQETLKKISDSLKKHYNENPNPFKGKKHSVESKKKMSDSCKKAMTQEKRKTISEANKGRVVSEDTKAKLRGRTPWNKGVSMPEETKKKLSETLKGTCSGEKNSFYGKHHTKETKKKISESNKGNTYNLGRKFSDEHKKKLSDAKKGNKNRLGGKKYLENN